ncbi:MAG: serine hydrolase [Draconibacterium sp.]
MNTICIQFFLILISINAFAQNIRADNDILRPVKTESAIIIDGKLNEPVWQKTRFTNRLYDENGEYNNTEAYLTYDADHLYAAFRCKGNDISKMKQEHLDKDDEQMLAHDWVAFCVDTYNDGITAFTFLADASGNMLDGALNTPNRDLSFSFSSKWIAAVNTNKDGYTVEMKIPLENLPVRWNKDSVKMAIQVIRNDRYNRRMVQWPHTRSIGRFQTLMFNKINQTYPPNLSGVVIADRLAFKKSKIDVTTLHGRCQGGDASVMDYLIFRKRKIEGAENPRMFPYNLEPQVVNESFENTAYFKNLHTNVDFETMLERAQTTAFIVLQNDTIVYEKYFNGFNKSSVFTSFSVAKSFVSTLIGLAVSDGYLKSEKDTITKYLPELLKRDKRFSQITIKDLLSMSAGIAYSGDGFPSDDDITYVSPDLRKATLDNVRIEGPPAVHWHYRKPLKIKNLPISLL